MRTNQLVVHLNEALDSTKVTTQCAWTAAMIAAQNIEYEESLRVDRARTQNKLRERVRTKISEITSSLAIPRDIETVRALRLKRYPSQMTDRDLALVGDFENLQIGFIDPVLANQLQECRALFSLRFGERLVAVDTRTEKVVGTKTVVKIYDLDYPLDDEELGRFQKIKHQFEQDD